MAIGELLATPRLTLLPCSPEHLLALIDRPEEFERLVGLPLATACMRSTCRLTYLKIGSTRCAARRSRIRGAMAFS